MGFITVPSIGGIIDDLKSVYDKLRPSVSSASQAIKEARKGGGTAAPIDAGVPAPAFDPSASERSPFAKLWQDMKDGWPVTLGAALGLAYIIYTSRKGGRK